MSVVEIDMEFQKIWNAYPGRGKDGATGFGYKGHRKRALTLFTNLYKKTKEPEQKLERILGPHVSVVVGGDDALARMAGMKK